MSPRAEPRRTPVALRVVAPVVVVVLAIAALSCGAPVDEGAASQDPSTTAAPTTVPSGTGGAEQATGPGGEPIAVARDLPDLPPDWPVDVPVADGAGPLTVAGFDAASPQDGRSVTYTSPRSAGDLVAFHTAQLTADGWTIDAEVPTSTGGALSASKTDGGATRTLFVTVSEEAGVTTVVLATSG